MVVVSGSWMKNVSACTQQIVSPDVVIADHNMTAKAILTCHPNSHPFQERTLILDQPVKVGRSVARAKPMPTNAIFDCKVLSRHHALLWYEDGKFFLQDTKSSNGTFVNNNRLSPESENHELISGDIVQFGVAVVENNKKVTHGCIVASIKLYMPDGREAKVVNSGMVPLDDLYKLNQIIQEANQREQCLEIKLTALQNAVDETRKSAEESWQAYVGEERLLSRVSALETQLQHFGKNWGEDKLREELTKLQEENEAYQVAAKEALEKLHSEKLDAVALALEKERARQTAEDEALLAKEQFAEIQLELELIAKRLTEQQNETAEQRAKLEQNEQDLRSKLEAETDKCLHLQLKLAELNNFKDFDDMFNINPSDERLSLKTIIHNDHVKSKEELLAENEVCESLNNTNDSHICLTVGPVGKLDNSESNEESERETNKILDESKRNNFSESLTLEEEDNNESHLESEETENDKEDSEKEDQIDSKTLKYQFQTVQNEMKRRIELLESVTNANKMIIAELRKNLDQEKETSQQRLEDNDKIKDEFVILQQQWKECCNENQQYQDKIYNLSSELDLAQNRIKETPEKSDSHDEHKKNSGSGDSSSLNRSLINYDQLVNLEEELVLMKERFAQVSEDKLKLQRDLLTLTDQYNVVCSRSHNKYFFYVAPLVFMVLYLLVSAMIS